MKFYIKQYKGDFYLTHKHFTIGDYGTFIYGFYGNHVIEKAVIHYVGINIVILSSEILSGGAFLKEDGFRVLSKIPIKFTYKLKNGQVLTEKNLYEKIIGKKKKSRLQQLIDNFR